MFEHVVAKKKLKMIFKIHQQSERVRWQESSNTKEEKHYSAIMK